MSVCTILYCTANVRAQSYVFNSDHHRRRWRHHHHHYHQFWQAKTIPEPRGDALREEATQLTPLLDWAIPEKRWLSHWDSKPKPLQRIPGIFEQVPPGQTSLKVTMAAPVADMVGRITLHAGPPVIRAPATLPAALPKTRPSFSNARYPAEPTSRLGVGVLVAAGHPYHQWPDVICGTSFIHALSGHNQYTQDTFYVQRYKQTLVVLHYRDQTWNTGQVGHRVENLLMGKSTGSFNASTMLRIGKHRVLVTSEVDGSSPPPPRAGQAAAGVVADADVAGRLVEIKSSKKGTGAVLNNQGLVVQLTCNGSKQLLVVSVDQREEKVDGLQWFDTDAIRHNECKLRNVYAGQRVRALLNHLLLRDRGGGGGGGDVGDDGGGGGGGGGSGSGGGGGDGDVSPIAAAAAAGGRRISSVGDAGTARPAKSTAQRSRYCLPEHPEELGAEVSQVFKLTFDIGKAPLFTRLPPNSAPVTVLPPDLRV